jgi:hypothetical protein
VVEVRPTAPLTPNGRTAVPPRRPDERGRHYRSFALVNTAALGNGYWEYYMTLLTAPAAVFPPALPLMTEIWNTLLQQHPGALPDGVRPGAPLTLVPGLAAGSAAPAP